MPAPSQAIGDVMPDLSLPLVGGGTITLSERLKDRRGALVAFWSGSCAHCVRYDAFFNTLEARQPDIALIAVAARRSETLEQIREITAERNLTFPIAHSADGRAAAEWFAPQTPRVYLVDGNRNLRYRGAIDNYKYKDDPAYRPYLDAAINDFLAGRALARTETPSFGCPIDSIYYLLPRTS